MSWTFENVHAVLDCIEIAPWYRASTWEVEEFGGDVFGVEGWAKVRFCVSYLEPDTETGQVEVQRGRWWYVEDDFTNDAIIKAAYAALVMSDEHRRREGFRVNGDLIFGPHQPIFRPMSLFPDDRHQAGNPHGVSIDEYFTPDGGWAEDGRVIRHEMGG